MAASTYSRGVANPSTIIPHSSSRLLPSYPRARRTSRTPRRQGGNPRSRKMGGPRGGPRRSVEGHHRTPKGEILDEGGVEGIAEGGSCCPMLPSSVGIEIQQTLSRSVSKRWSRGRDSNPRPADYESAALPLSYLGIKTASHSITGSCALSVDRSPE